MLSNNLDDFVFITLCGNKTAEGKYTKFFRGKLKFNSLTKSSFTKDDTIELGEQLDNNCISELDLSNNQLTDEDIKVLSSYLKTNHSVKFLNLSHNCITREGLKELAYMLAQNRSIVYLDLSDNNNSFKRCEDIVDYIRKHNYSLVYLDLRNRVILESNMYNTALLVYKNTNAYDSIDRYNLKTFKKNCQLVLEGKFSNLTNKELDILKSQLEFLLVAQDLPYIFAEFQMDKLNLIGIQNKLNQQFRNEIDKLLTTDCGRLLVPTHNGRLLEKGLSKKVMEYVGNDVYFTKQVEQLDVPKIPDNEGKVSYKPQTIKEAFGKCKRKPEQELEVDEDKENRNTQLSDLNKLNYASTSQSTQFLASSSTGISRGSIESVNKPTVKHLESSEKGRNKKSRIDCSLKDISNTHVR